MVIFAIITAIAGALASAGGYVVDSIKLVWDGVWKLISVFLDHAPKPLQIFIFLFLLVTVGNLFSNFFLGSNYACTTTNQLYQADSVFDGIGNRVRMTFFGWSLGETDTFIISNYDHIEQKADITNVRCAGGDPKLFFYSVDIFSYNLWVLLLILLYGTPMALKYYKSMGALH